MDLFFLIISLVVITILCVVYSLGHIASTTDLAVIHRSIQRIKPDCIAFTVGKSKDGSYRNALLNQQGVLEIKEQPFPVTLDGRFAIPREHGTVSENPKGSGFRISGLGFEPKGDVFECPVGYGGVSCHLLPLCDDSVEPGSLHLLTYAQFRGLDLYGVGSNARLMPAGSRKRRAITEDGFVSYHPRIRVQCLGGPGNPYQLQTCPPNMLLNEKTLECESYDLCQDRLNGYKHNYDLADDSTEPLQSDNEYYLCDHNRSVKRVCPEGTVFSSQAQGCITDSPCFNRGFDTLPKDDNSYIQCANDTGSIVRCPFGVDMHIPPEDSTIDDDVRYACRSEPNKCEPELFWYEDATIRYAYGAIQCKDGPYGPETQTLCTDQGLPTTRVYRWKWAESFQYELPNWPVSVWDERTAQCQSPTDDIIAQPIIKLRWSNLMAQSHPFNLRTKQYECEASQYRWDYITGESIPQLPSEGPESFGTLSPAKPCQDRPLLGTREADGLAYDLVPHEPIRLRTVNDVRPPIGFRVPALMSNMEPADLYWPQRTKDTTTSYYWLGIREIEPTDSESTSFLELTRTVSTELPAGFVEAADMVPSTALALVGCSKENTFPIRNTEMYFVLATGQITPPQGPPSMITTTVVARIEQVTFGQTVSVPAQGSLKVVALGALYLRGALARPDNNQAPIEVCPALTLSPHPRTPTFTFNGVSYEWGYVCFTLDRTDEGGTTNDGDDNQNTNSWVLRLGSAVAESSQSVSELRF